MKVSRLPFLIPIHQNMNNCAPLLADLFLHSYEAEFVQELLRKGEKKLAQSFNYMFRYIDDVL